MLFHEKSDGVITVGKLLAGVDDQKITGELCIIVPMEIAKILDELKEQGGLCHE